MGKPAEERKEIKVKKRKLSKGEKVLVCKYSCIHILNKAIHLEVF